MICLSIPMSIKASIRIFLWLCQYFLVSFRENFAKPIKKGDIGFGTKSVLEQYFFLFRSLCWEKRTTEKFSMKKKWKRNLEEDKNLDFFFVRTWNFQTVETFFWIFRYPILRPSSCIWFRGSRTVCLHAVLVTQSSEKNQKNKKEGTEGIREKSYFFGLARGEPWEVSSGPTALGVFSLLPDSLIPWIIGSYHKLKYIFSFLIFVWCCKQRKWSGWSRQETTFSFSLQ